MTKPLPAVPEGQMTRRRMAQIQRRLREKERKMKEKARNAKLKAEEKRNKLSSTGPKDPAPKPDDPNSPRKILRDLQLQRLAKRMRKKTFSSECKEYYPKKLKREISYKKVKLTPKQELVKLGYINKRKRREPRRRINSELSTDPEHVSSVATKETLKSIVNNKAKEETVEEIIMRIDATDSLTDEDLMEILTCPSPVWWEEPANPFYFDEEPINKGMVKSVLERRTLTTKSTAAVSRIDKLEINLQNRGEKFVKKRSTLEKILGNLKSYDGAKINKNVKAKEKPANQKLVKDLENSDMEVNKTNTPKSLVLKATFGSSPVSISDASDIDEPTYKNKNNPNCVATTSQEIDVVKDNIQKADVSEISNASVRLELNNDSDNIMTSSTNQTTPNIKQPTKSNDEDVEMLPEHSLDRSKINKNFKDIKSFTKTAIDSILGINADLVESPKALIWTSCTGERKIVNFTQDSEKSSDGVEFVGETFDQCVPVDMPPLIWYPKTTKSSPKSNTSDHFSAINDLSNEVKEKSSQSSNSFQSLNEEANNDTQTKSPNADFEKKGVENNFIHLNNCNSYESDNIKKFDKHDVVSATTTNNNERANPNKDTQKLNNLDDSETISDTDITKSNALMDVIERAMDYFRKRNKDVSKNKKEEEKKQDDYVVVYKIDESFKNKDELQKNTVLDDLNKECCENRDVLSGTLDNFYKKYKNGHRKVLSKKDD